jgi:hypothetical protein
MMTLTELLPQLKELSREDKLQAMEFLRSEIVKEAPEVVLQPGKTYEVWSPYDAFEAANLLQKMLEEHQQAEEQKRTDNA